MNTEPEMLAAIAEKAQAQMQASATSSVPSIATASAITTASASIAAPSSVSVTATAANSNTITTTAASPAVDIKTNLDTLLKNVTVNSLEKSLTQLGENYLKQLSAQDNMRIAEFFYKNTNVPKSNKWLQKAIAYYEKASSQGNRKAKYRLGIIFLTNLSLSNTIKAFRYFKASADAGHRLAKLNLANCYIEGNGVQQDIKLAKELLCSLLGKQDKWLAKHIDNIRFQIFRCDMLVKFSNKNFTDINSIIEKLQKEPEGNEYAAYYLAEMCVEGLGVSVDRSRAFKILNNRNKLTYPPALRLLGNLYEQGIPNEVDPNIGRAVLLYKAAAGKGSIIAAHHLAFCCLFGTGTKINYKKAYQLYQIIFSNGMQTAAVGIQICKLINEFHPFIDKTADEKNIKEAQTIDISINMPLIEQLAQDGNKNISLILGKYFYSKNNLPKAIHYFRQALPLQDQETSRLLLDCLEMYSTNYLTLQQETNQLKSALQQETAFLRKKQVTLNLKIQELQAALKTTLSIIKTQRRQFAKNILRLRKIIKQNIKFKSLLKKYAKLIKEQKQQIDSKLKELDTANTATKELTAQKAHIDAAKDAALTELKLQSEKINQIHNELNSLMLAQETLLKTLHESTVILKPAAENPIATAAPLPTATDTSKTIETLKQKILAIQPQILEYGKTQAALLKKHEELYLEAKTNQEKLTAALKQQHETAATINKLNTDLQNEKLAQDKLRTEVKRTAQAQKDESEKANDLARKLEAVTKEKKKLENEFALSKKINKKLQRRMNSQQLEEGSQPLDSNFRTAPTATDTITTASTATTSPATSQSQSPNTVSPTMTPLYQTRATGATVILPQPINPNYSYNGMSPQFLTAASTSAALPLLQQPLSSPSSHYSPTEQFLGGNVPSLPSQPYPLESYTGHPSTQPPTTHLSPTYAYVDFSGQYFTTNPSDAMYSAAAPQAMYSPAAQAMAPTVALQATYQALPQATHQVATQAMYSAPISQAVYSTTATHTHPLLQPLSQSRNLLFDGQSNVQPNNQLNSAATFFPIQQPQPATSSTYANSYPHVQQVSPSTSSIPSLNLPQSNPRG